MEILKRSRNAEMDIVPATESESNVREEVNRRSHKAGYTDRDGQPRISPEIVSRPPSKKYRENYDKIKW